MNNHRPDRSAADHLAGELARWAVLIDARLAARGLAPPRLHLPDSVYAELEQVFGRSVDPHSVVIRLGHLPGIPHRRAFALPGLVYTGCDPAMVLLPAAGHVGPPAGPARHDDSRRHRGTTGPRWRPTPTLVHEMVHIWQGRHLGPGYLWRSLRDQVRLGRRAYDWRLHLDEAGWPADGWSRLPVESQAQLIGDVYAGRASDGPARAAAQHASTVLRAAGPGGTAVDLT